MQWTRAVPQVLRGMPTSPLRCGDCRMPAAIRKVCVHDMLLSCVWLTVPMGMQAPRLAFLLILFCCV